MSVLTVFGPPGTGKTQKAIKFVEEELGRGIYPQEISFVSFTRAAAYNARDRTIEAFPEYSPDDFLYFRTIHSICFRELNLSPENIFNDKLKEFSAQYGYAFSADGDEDMFSQNFSERVWNTDADAFESFISWQKNKMVWDFDEAYRCFIRQHTYLQDTYLPDNFTKPRLQLYISRREEFKEKNRLWDYCELVIECLRRNVLPRGIKVLISDESQDLSPLLFDWVKRVSETAEKTYIFGDCYQALFSWQGAEPDLMLSFPADERITLRQSYRCSQAVHDLSRKIVEKRFKTRYPDDDFLPTPKKGEIVRAATFDYLPYEETFYLFRTRYLLNQAYLTLISRGIPLVTRRGRWSPLDQRAGKADVFASLLKLSREEPITLAELKKIVSFLPQKDWLERGTKKEIEALQPSQQLIEWHDLPEYGFTEKFLSYLTPDSFLEPLREKEFPAWVKSYLRKVFDKYGIRGIKHPTLQLGTYHSVKGLEANRVVIDPTYTRLPYQNLAGGNEEEHRLMYTAITRAKDKIIILRPSSDQYYIL